ncbi:predicted sulfurylase large subunit, molybdopterin cytosine dinucleotide biosynthesis [Rhizobiales bacterium GAS191]|jgi:xanthine dehydrogenase accessory factor|nr:predicted sulfurylase large subunit, molybdopterin cytosine dinucleotide biosynthesis [Rhizobiales bacterium GAS113]SEE49072.1 predicted sulfurylase large subunit, molybdopterin cytosine dinucleotide biosynthesis [Rhizobiales bacterium GAS191]
MKIALLSVLNAEREKRTPAVLVTDLDSGEQRLVKAGQVKKDPLAGLLHEQLRLGKSGTIEEGGKRYFLTVQAPPVRIMVTGAVHISQALAPMARLVDYEVAIVDPRTAFASPERFPGVNLHAVWPDAYLKEHPLDRYTALVALTHDPKIDDVALIAALKADCFYIGALGSRRTHAKRLERLMEAGFSEADLARISAPIGLDIGAATPAEIALATLAQLTAALRNTAAAVPKGGAPKSDTPKGEAPKSKVAASR